MNRLAFVATWVALAGPGCGDPSVSGFSYGYRGELLFSHEHQVVLEGMETTVGLPAKISEFRGGGRGSLTPGREVVLYEAPFESARVEVTTGEEIPVVAVERVDGTSPAMGAPAWELQGGRGLRIRVRGDRLTPRPVELRVKLIVGDKTVREDYIDMECWKGTLRFFTRREDVPPHLDPETYFRRTQVSVGEEFVVPYELRSPVGGGDSTPLRVPPGSPLEILDPRDQFGLKLRAVAPGKDPVVLAGTAQAVLPIEITGH